MNLYGNEHPTRLIDVSYTAAGQRIPQYQEVKYCPECTEEKNIEEFHKGEDGICRSCWDKQDVDK